MTQSPHIIEPGLSDTTVAATGSLRQHLPQLPIILVSCALSASGTSSAQPYRVWEAPYVHEFEATASGQGWAHQVAAACDAETTREAIGELRRISGLTWEQLGELFSVSRRSVHFWASGKPLNAENERRLMQVLKVVRDAARGDARSTRAALFDVKHGTTAFEMLKAERFHEAGAILGSGTDRQRSALAELSAAAKAARKPLAPEELVDAQHDRVHRDRGRGRAARTARNKRRGST